MCAVITFPGVILLGAETGGGGEKPHERASFLNISPENALNRCR
jgi:hypothetical protein